MRRTLLVNAFSGGEVDAVPSCGSGGEVAELADS
jgi:hypothetical protein